MLRSLGGRMRRLGLLSIALAFAASCAGDEPASNDDAADSPDDGADDADDDAPGDTSGADDDDGGSTTGDAPADGPTYYDDVLPIFIEQCGTCHSDGGIGPFDIGVYETARVLAPSIAGQVQARIMP